MTPYHAGRGRSARRRSRDSCWPGPLGAPLTCLVCFACLCALAGAFGGVAVAAQEDLRGSQPRQREGQGTTSEQGAEQNVAEENEGNARKPGTQARISRFATLHRDLDIATALAKAEEFADSGDYETAVRLLQKAFEADRQVLIQRGERVFRPAHLVAQDLLLSWPPEALKEYRLVNDPTAAALLERFDKQFDPALLSQIVQRYFLTAHGDEAAFRLACYRLDRGEFASAYRLLAQLHERYPRPTVSNEAVLLRLAVASEKTGQSAKARRLWAEYRDEATGPEPSWRRDVEQLVEAKANTIRTPDRGYTGSPVQLAALPEEEQEQGLSMVSRWAACGFPARQRGDRFALFRDLLEFAWAHDGKRPVDTFLADGDRVWTSSPFGVGGFSVGGRKLWSDSGAEPGRHLGIEQTQELGLLLVGLQGESLGVWSAFSDHMEGRISRAGDILYRVEGSWLTFYRRSDRDGRGRQNAPIRNGSHLAAYDSGGGRLLWRVGGGQEKMEASLGGARFLNAPVPVGKNVLVCFEKNDELRLAALAPGSGQVNWEVSLCSYEASVAAPESSVGIAVEGTTVFILTGKGAVFSVDGLTGAVHWVTTYDRVHDTSRPASRLLWAHDHPPRPVTWEENRVYVVGRRLLVMPYDAPLLLCFDRASGELIYRAGAAKTLYPLGVSDRGLIVAGEGFIEARNVETGKPVWRERVPATTGRGLLTDRGILLPVHDEVRVLSTETGEPVGRFVVALDREVPLGNLHAHDGQLYATGVGHIVRIDPVTALRDELNRAVAAGDDPTAIFERGKLRMRLGAYRAAVDDLRKAYDMADEDPQRVELLEAMLRRAAEGGDDAEGLLAEAEEMARDHEEQRRVLVATMDAAANRGEFERAFQAGYRLLAHSRGRMLAPDNGRPAWRVAPALWLRMKTEKLLVEGGQQARTALQTVAAKQLSELRNGAGDTVGELYQLLLASPPVPATIRAGLAAADEAVEQGNPAQAELVLLQMVDALERPVEVAGMVALAEFYERRGWPRIALRTWQQLADTAARDASVVTRDGTALVEDLTKAAVNRLAGAEEHASGHEGTSLPSPPYKLAWTTELVGRPLRTYHKDMIRSDFTDEHFFPYDHRAKKLSCRALLGKDAQWEHEVSERGGFMFRGHTAFRSTYGTLPRAFSLLSGRDVWPATDEPGASLDLKRSRIQMSGGIFIAHGDNSNGFGQLAALDATTGRVLWRDLLLQRSGRFAFNEVLAANMLRRRQAVETEQGELENQYVHIVQLFKVRTGEFINDSLRLSTHNGTFALTREGVLEARDNKVVLRRADDNKTLWEHTLKEGERARVYGIEGSSLMRIQSQSVFALFDPDKREILWTVSAAQDGEGPDWGENWGPGHIYREAATLPGTDAIWLEGQLRRGRIEFNPVRIIDPRTGESQLFVANDGDVRLRFDNAIANDDHILVRYQRFKTKGRRRYTAESNIRLLSRKTGKLVPDSVMPPAGDRGDDKESRAGYAVDLIGARLLFTNRSKALLYEHHDPAENTDSHSRED